VAHDTIGSLNDFVWDEWNAFASFFVCWF